MLAAPSFRGLQINFPVAVGQRLGESEVLGGEIKGQGRVMGLHSRNAGE